VWGGRAQTEDQDKTGERKEKQWWGGGGGGGSVLP